MIAPETPPPADRMTYSMRQAVELFEWVGEVSPQRHEKYDRDGLILVEATYPNGRWLRTIEEYVLGLDYLDALRGLLSVNRADLQARQGNHLTPKEIEFGASGPFTLVSDPRNTNPVLSSGEGMPISYDQIYLPTVLPALPRIPVPDGQPWPGSVQLHCRGAELAVGYSVQKIGLQAGIAKLTVTFDGTPAIATNEKMKISLFITGTIDYSISISDGAPMTANGTLTSRVHANYRNIREQPMDVDWCRGTNVFSYERVLIPFTEEEIFPLHWKPRDDTLRGNPTVRP